MAKKNYIDVDYLWEKHPDFFLDFGRIMLDICTVDELFYCVPSLAMKGETSDFEIDFLTQEEIDELMERSEKDGVDYLYERVKDRPCIDDYSQSDDIIL